MRDRTFWPASILCAALSFGLASAQGQEPADEPPPPEDNVSTDDDEIVVIGDRNARPYGSALGDIAPENVLDGRDVRALGVSNLSEVLEELAPLTNSGRGRGGEQPIVLVNGRRIGSFKELRGYPPESVLRIDILPEEVALNYGYSADQKVVNFVLRPRFRAVTVDSAAGGSTAGDYDEQRASINRLSIRRTNRVSLDGAYKRSGELLESDRDIIGRRARDPFGIPGNVFPAGGGELDPALTALVGETVTVAALPDSFSGATPVIDDFVDGANMPSKANEARYRTLLAGSEAIELGASWSRPLMDSATITGSLSFDAGASTSLLGLPTSDVTVLPDNSYSPFEESVLVRRRVTGLGPLERENTTRSTEATLNAFGDFNPDWRWNTTLRYEHADRETETDRRLDQTLFVDAVAANDPAVNPFGPIDLDLLRIGSPDLSKSNTEDVRADALITGKLLTVPAGDVRISLRPSVRYEDINSESRRGDVSASAFFSRRTAATQVNLNVPLARARADGPVALGELTVNANVRVEDLSDAGVLWTTGAGLNWRPTKPYRVIASWTREEGAASVDQLGTPPIATPNVRVFDYSTGETVEVTRLSAGNPNLEADTRTVYRLGLTAEPFDLIDLTLNASYTDNRLENPISAFPSLTAEIERAFPERFLRGPEGALVLIDARPINFDERRSRQVAWGLTYSKQFESDTPSEPPVRIARREETPPDAPSEGQPAEADRAERPVGAPGPRGFGGGRRGNRNAARLTLNLNHTWRLEETIDIGPGIPPLDLLNGSSTGNRGGQSEHVAEFQANWTKSGIGARLSAKWESDTSVLIDRTDSVGSPDDLFFSDTSRVDLRLFVDFTLRPSVIETAPFLAGSRLSLEVDNLFDTRPQVVDGAGTRPLAYQEDLLDPKGRIVRLTFRKLFIDRSALRREREQRTGNETPKR